VGGNFMVEHHTKKQSTLNDKITRFSEEILFLMFALMVIVVFLNVILRFVFNYSFPASEEIARYSFIWTVFIGAALALDKNEHIGVDMVVAALPKKAQKWVLLVANLLLIIFSLICGIYGFKLCQNNMGWPSPATKISYGLVGIIMPISFFAMTFVIIRKTINLFKEQ